MEQDQNSLERSIEREPRGDLLNDATTLQQFRTIHEGCKEMQILMSNHARAFGESFLSGGMEAFKFLYICLSGLV